MSFEHRYKLGATFALIGQYKLSYRWLKSFIHKVFKETTHFIIGFHTPLTILDMKPSLKKCGSWHWKTFLIKKERSLGASVKKLRRFFNRKWMLQRKEVCNKQCSRSALQLVYGKKTSSTAASASLEEIKSSIHMSTLLDEVYTYVWQDKQHVIFEVADVIELEMEWQTESDTQDLLSFWFYVYVQVYKQSYDFQHVNVNAWAAAVTYIWAKRTKPVYYSSRCGKTIFHFGCNS